MKTWAALCLAVLAGVPWAAPAQTTYTLPAVLPADSTGREGFLRIVNRSFQAGDVRIHAFDDTGERFGPVTLALDAYEAVHLTSRDLERGSAGIGLPVGVGDGEGSWRLEFDSALDVVALGYIRTSDGFHTSMHDVVPVAEGAHRVLFFNPGSNTSKVSHLRIVNPGTTEAEVTVTGRDDAGDPASGTVSLTLPAGGARTLTAQALEAGGEGFEGSLGDGAGKWRLTVTASRAIEVMSLLQSRTGHLANVSTEPETAASGLLTLPLVLPAEDGAGREGFMRIVNRSGQAGTVAVTAIDDTGERFGPVTLALDAYEAVHLTSRDLERGSAGIGLPVGVGDGEGSWRLEFDSALDVVALGYIRTSDGFHTSMHDVVPVAEGAHRVLFFNPGSNTSKVSHLRIVNPGTTEAEVTVTGRDDAGDPASGTVSLTLPAGGARTLTAQALEAGGEGFEGSLGDGAGKWRLTVTASRAIEVMSLLQTRTGHLSNVSTEPDRPLASLAQNTYTLPLVLAADREGLTGFVRIVNRSFQSGTVRIHAIDDTGRRFGPVTLTLGASAVGSFDSRDLEQGNASKGLAAGVGDGVGDWWLELDTDLTVTPLAYIRTTDGFVTGMHDVAPETAEDSRMYQVAFFNPGSNTQQVSRLRLINPGTTPAEVTMTGVDDAGDLAPGGTVRLTLPAGGARTLTAQELEAGGDGFEGRLGDGAGKWRLTVEANTAIDVMSLLRSSAGLLANLSTEPDRWSSGVYSLPLVLAADSPGLTGVIRIVNHSVEAGTVRITAIDDTGERFGPVPLSMEAESVVSFNSRDLEQGNASKGLLSGVGDGEGDWRLEFDTDLFVTPLAYVRTPDGFVTSVHDVVPVSGQTRRVVFFNPASNASQVSRLRLINTGTGPAEVSIYGDGDDGQPTPSGEVRLTLPAGASRSLTAQELEGGGDGFEGSLGDGAGRWRLSVTTIDQIEVMSLLASPTGHLSNLSTEPPVSSAEQAATFADATPIVPEGEVSGRLASGGKDYYRLTVDEPSILTMNVSGETDVVVSVFDERGYMITQSTARAAAAGDGRISARIRGGAFTFARVKVQVPGGRSVVRVTQARIQRTVAPAGQYVLAPTVERLGLRQIGQFPEVELHGNETARLDLKPYFEGVNRVSGISLDQFRVRTPWGTFVMSLDPDLVLTVRRAPWGRSIVGRCGSGGDNEPLRLSVSVTLDWWQPGSLIESQKFGGIPLVVHRSEAPYLSGDSGPLALSTVVERPVRIRLDDWIHDPEGEALTFRMQGYAPGWYVTVRSTTTGNRTDSTLTAFARPGAKPGVTRVRATDPDGVCTEFPVHLSTGVWRCCRVVSNLTGFYSCGCVLEDTSRRFTYVDEWIRNVLSCKTWSNPDAGEVHTATRVGSCGCESEALREAAMLPPFLSYPVPPLCQVLP